MNNNKEPNLELIPGINLGNDAEKKEAEAKGNSNQQLPEIPVKGQPNLTSSIGKKESGQSIDSETKDKLLILREKILKGIYSYDRFSIDLSPSLQFLRSFVLTEDKKYKIEEDSQKLKEKYSPKKFNKNDESSELDNAKKFFGYNNIERDPVKEGLLNRIEQLKANQKQIDFQFKKDCEIYEKRISSLEKACQENPDEAKIKRLEQENKEKKDLVKEYQKSIEQGEKDKINDKNYFHNALSTILELKSILMTELKELEILAKNTSFHDYNEYLNNNPTKIEKLNFRPNDSRYLLTNEYESSREEEESYSSYEKLNHINNTPEGFDINKKNNSMNKTENFFFNTKNFVGTVGSGNNNINTSFNNKVNYSSIINNKNNNNKDIEKYSFKKNGTLDSNKNRKIIVERNIRSNTITNKNNLSNFNNNNLKNKIQDNNSIINGKKISPSDFRQNYFPKDPDFLNEKMILIHDMRKEDTFY